MTETPETIVLPPLLDFRQAPKLYDMLRKCIDMPMILDATDVIHLGAPCMQILISANRKWREKSLPLNVKTPSVAFHESLERMGITADEIGKMDQTE